MCFVLFCFTLVNERFQNEKKNRTKHGCAGMYAKPYRELFDLREFNASFSYIYVYRKNIT